MNAGQVVKQARKRAGLSQRELAELLATTQPVIARWESGASAPSFDRVVEAVRASGFDLSVSVVTPDDQHELQIEGALMLSPVERLRQLAQGQAAIERLVASARRRNDEL